MSGLVPAAMVSGLVPAAMMGALLVALVAGASPARAQPSPERPGTHIDFHGWSPDGRRVAYTRTRIEPRRGAPPQVAVRRALREVVDGQLRPVRLPRGRVTRDLAAWAAGEGYVARAVPPRVVDEARTWLSAPEGLYEVRVAVEEDVSWELRFEERVLARQAFDTPYVAWDVALYPSPDRRHAVLVMHLDSGWTVDAAVYAVPLPPDIATRWRKVTEALQRATGTPVPSSGR